MLELDHVLCMMAPEDAWAHRLEAAGWSLDAGTSHGGQGTRNRRLIWAEQYLELAWVDNPDEARSNPLRLDRRAAWRTTGASPFGFGLRGRLPLELEPAFWLYGELGFPIWIHRDNEDRPDRPLVFVLDLPAHRGDGRAGRAERLLAIDHRGPAPADLPPYIGAACSHRPGPHHVQLTVDSGGPVEASDHLAIRVDER